MPITTLFTVGLIFKYTQLFITKPTCITRSIGLFQTTKIQFQTRIVGFLKTKLLLYSLPLLVGLDVECALDDSGPLQPSYDECVGFGPVCTHDLTPLNSEVVERICRTLGFVLVADETAILQ